MQELVFLILKLSDTQGPPTSLFIQVCVGEMIPRSYRLTTPLG